MSLHQTERESTTAIIIAYTDDSDVGKNGPRDGGRNRNQQIEYRADERTSPLPVSRKGAPSASKVLGGA